MIKLLQGDCLELMKDIEDKSIDLVLADPPYGITACKWDSVIPLDLMWEQLKRITKDNAAIIMTASQPFTTTLISSNKKMFKYCWVWDKKRISNPQLAKIQPLKQHEDVVVFCKKKSKYFPQGIKNTEKKKVGDNNGNEKLGHIQRRKDYVRIYTNYPRSIIYFKSEIGLHPTQKPVALMEYMIKTYTNENDIVLDFCMGSGTTGVACKNLNRNFIGIELDKEYFKIAKERIETKSIQKLIK